MTGGQSYAWSAGAPVRHGEGVGISMEEGSPSCSGLDLRLH